MRISTLPLALVALLTLASPLLTAQYEGWSDTGWVYASKRDCCDAAMPSPTRTARRIAFWPGECRGA